MTSDKASYKKSSFGPAFLFLDQKRRNALAFYYAFCRRMDDIADEPNVKDPQQELAFWRAEIGRVFEDRAQTRLGRELAQVSAQFAIQPDRFLLLIEGMEADLAARSYQTFEDLQWYLWRVAGVVGCATLDILGVRGPKAQELARSLGFAVQLTNIVRDVHEDAAMGRVYLPEELLKEHGLTREDVLQNAKPAQLAAALEQTARQAQEFYRRAGAVMKRLPARKMLPCRVMACVYRANLAKIEKTKFKFVRAVKLSKAEKLLHCVYALFKTDIIC